MKGLLTVVDCYFEETAFSDALLDVWLVFVVIYAHDLSFRCAVFEGSSEVELVAEEMRTSGWPIGEKNESSTKKGKRGCWQLISQDFHCAADETLYIFGLHCSSLSVD